jgi:hypothetical protein
VADNISGAMLTNRARNTDQMNAINIFSQAKLASTAKIMKQFEEKNEEHLKNPKITAALNHA